MWAWYRNEIIAPRFEKFTKLSETVPLLVDGKNDSIFRLNSPKRLRKNKCKSYKVCMNGEIVDELCFICKNFIIRSFVNNEPNCLFENDNLENTYNQSVIDIIQETIEIPPMLLMVNILDQPIVSKMECKGELILRNIEYLRKNATEIYYDIDEDFCFNWYFTKKLTLKPDLESYILKINGLHKRLTKYNAKELDSMMKEMLI